MKASMPAAKYCCFTISIALLLVAHTGCSFESIPAETTTAAAVRQAPQVHPATPRGDLLPDEQATVGLFKKVSPSVVYITTLARRANLFTGAIDQIPRGTGTGFVWDRQGHIVTNYHVLQGANSAQVVLHDQTTYGASLVGVSAGHDLAVLRIDASSEDLQPVVIGESTSLRVGQSIFAIGNPFGLSATLTTGIVSALGRQIEGTRGRPIENVIQIDAAINPGNSGGPLLDSAGRLVGVNTAIYSPSGASAGIGFAVPVDTVRRVVPQLIETGDYIPPQLGITVNQQVSAVVLARLRLSGVLVWEVQPGSGAATAGLRGSQFAGDGSLILGDIIQRLDDEEVSSFGELQAMLDRYNPGDVVSVTTLRGGRTRTVRARLS